jgi:glycosyltransferase involved in cell wall biosynthesis
VPRISAIIISKNEALNIAACLDSVAFCDEIVVVDSGSTDRTADIARAKGALVVTHAFAGFGPQKNFALAQAGGDWVLSIDADERVSKELKEAILAVLETNDVDAYEMPRMSTFLGRAMRHSGWHPDYVLRLFRRGRAKFSDDLVHERVICEGIIERLGVALDHHPVRRLEDAISRVDRYSTAGAEMYISSRRKVSFMSGITHGLWSFLRAYVFRLGFLDGPEGFLLAIANAEGTYYRYMKAWLAERRRG